MENNLFSICHCGVTSGKVQGSEVCLDMSLPSAAATRQVILGNKCVPEGVLSPGKGTTFAGREIGASSAKTFNSGAKSFRAAQRMLNAQCFISSPLSTRGIKVRITRICENRSCEYLQILRKSANYIRKISCISQQNLLARVREKHGKSIAFFKIFNSIRTSISTGIFTLPSVGIIPLYGGWCEY